MLFLHHILSVFSTFLSPLPAVLQLLNVPVFYTVIYSVLVIISHNYKEPISLFTVVVKQLTLAGGCLYNEVPDVYCCE